MNGKSTTENELYNFLSTTLGNQDIPEKCKQLSLYVNSYESQFLHSIFPRVLEDIFMTAQRSNWGLTVFHPRSYEFTCVREFLGPKGSIFRMIEKIQEDEFLPKFSLPNVLVPLHMKAKVEAELANGIKIKTKSAFELYFCYFSSYITKTMQNKSNEAYHINHPYRTFTGTSMPVAPEEYLYFSLLNDYLSHFMPTEGQPPTMGSGHNANTYKYAKSHYGVTKASFLLRHDSGKDYSYGPSSSKEMRCCDVLLQLFCMFWLDDFQFVFPTIVPTENHVRAVRQLIKHIHSFCNAHSDHSLQKRFQSDLATEQLNQNMLLRLQPVLSDFFCHCFEVWPLDCNFRIVLETWLSFIQPWRYNSTGDVRLDEDRNVANMWYHFIYNNLSFYNKLFQLAVTRFIRVDMSSPENAMLLYRITKIYGQPNLVTLIEEAEEAISGNTKNMPCHLPGGNYESYLGSSQHHDSMVRQMEEDFIFTDKFRDAINQLLLVSAQALNTIKSTKDSTGSDFSYKFLHYMGYGTLFEQDRQENPSLMKSKMEQYLTLSMKSLADMFDLPIPDANSQAKWNKNEKHMADYVITEDGKKVLSPLGRHQLKNNLRRFSVRPHTEYDLQPVRSFENAFLVRLLYTLSSKFNAKFAAKINEKCHKGDFVSRILKITFQDDNENFSDQTRTDCKYRLSLRFLAHYRNVFYLVFLYIFSKVLGLNFFLVFFGLLLCGLLYIFIKALLIK